MVDDWWQSAPGKIAAHPTLRWESGGESAAIFPVNTLCTVAQEAPLNSVGTVAQPGP